MRSMVHKLIPEKYDVMKWQTQAINITTNFEVKVDFTLPTLITMNVVTWKFHVYESARGRYDILLGRDIFT